MIVRSIQRSEVGVGTRKLTYSLDSFQLAIPELLWCIRKVSLRDEVTRAGEVGGRTTSCVHVASNNRITRNEVARDGAALSRCHATEVARERMEKAHCLGNYGSHVCEVQDCGHIDVVLRSKR